MGCLLVPGFSQLDTSGLWVNIDSITVSATKISKKWLNSTRAISEVNTSSTKEILPQVTFQDYVNEMPGLFAINNQNKAQDLRISVRGFGLRSAFGVRGIKLVVDGIPETTPDGQGQIDVIPLGLIQKVELIKGPSAVLYGNASGGVLNITTLSENNNNLLAKPLLTGRVAYGSFNTQQYQLTYGRKINRTSFIFHGNQTRSDGYRNQSYYLTRHVKARMDHSFSKYSKINLMVDYLTRPTAEDAGSLTLSEAELDPRQARGQNVQQQTGEDLSNFKASATYSYKTGNRSHFDSYGFYSSRSFNGALPFVNGGLVSLDRTYFGQGTSYTIRSVTNVLSSTVKYGYDIANQFDNRKRFENLSGEQGASTLNQRESFKNLGLYIIGDVDFGGMTVNAGLRFDHNSIHLEDVFFFDGDDSGSRSYTRFNPNLGLNINLDAATSLFANVSTGFDTPTLNELSNNPDSLGGFSSLLTPQSSVSFELGAKIQVTEQIKGQFTLFNINTKDEITPYSDSNYPDRIFYRNIGSSKRVGLEIECSYQLMSSLAVSASYSLASYKYDNYQVDTIDYSGNILPGVPSHNAFVSLQYQHPLGLSVILENQLISSIYLNDANTAQSDRYILSNLHLGYKVAVRSYSVQPFISFKNILGSSYFDNLRINAFGDRYYEPAPGFNFFGGVKFNI